MLSRVADSVYWMARYIERAENVARYVDVSLESSLDGPNNPGKQWMPLVAAAGDQGLFLEKYGEGMAARDRGAAIMRFLAFDQDYPNSIVSCVTKARENARQVRGSLALEAWEHLNKFYHYLNSPEARRRVAESPHDFFTEIRTASYLFEGIVESTMSRGEEYNFLKLGRSLERADQTSRILDVKYFILLPTPADVGSVVDDLLWAALLHSVSGYEMFRKRHGRIVPEKVVDFLVLDREFPRAILYSLERAEECLLNCLFVVNEQRLFGGDQEVRVAVRSVFHPTDVGETADGLVHVVEAEDDSYFSKPGVFRRLRVAVAKGTWCGGWRRCSITISAGLHPEDSRGCGLRCRSRGATPQRHRCRQRARSCRERMLQPRGTSSRDSWSIPGQRRWKCRAPAWAGTQPDCSS